MVEAPAIAAAASKNKVIARTGDLGQCFVLICRLSPRQIQRGPTLKWLPVYAGSHFDFRLQRAGSE
jgi:hypothetical protein